MKNWGTQVSNLGKTPFYWGGKKDKEEPQKENWWRQKVWGEHKS